MFVLTAALALSACVAPDDGDETSTESAISEAPLTTFTLTASAFEGGVILTNPDGTQTLCDGCTKTYAAGSVVQLVPAERTNTVDCVQFNHWNGSCAGQGITCTLTINANDITSVAYSHINGCTPK
jgi:hypothetical protein